MFLLFQLGGDMDVISTIHKEASKYCKSNPHIRYGQAIFNISHTMFPQEVNTLRGTLDDCFYKDDRIEGFLAKLDAMVNKGEE